MGMTRIQTLSNQRLAPRIRGSSTRWTYLHATRPWKNQPPPPAPSKNRIPAPPKKSASSVLPQSQSSTTTAHIRTSGAHENSSRKKPTPASAGSGVQIHLPSRGPSTRPAQLSSHPTVTAPPDTKRTSGPLAHRFLAGSQPTPAHRISPQRAAPPQHTPGRIYPTVHPSPRPNWVDAQSSSPEPGQSPAAIFQKLSQDRQASAHSEQSEMRQTHTYAPSPLLRNVVSGQANPPPFFAPRPSAENARPNAVFFASALNVSNTARLASLASPSSDSARMLFSPPARPTFSPAQHRSSPLNPSAQPSRVAYSLHPPMQMQCTSSVSTIQGYSRYLSSFNPTHIRARPSRLDRRIL
ncbi:hypothetical protein CYLTODRAFT_45308 [Cylindrobasidium torrendii FP15055 ss-10]|uniref:Uncharacterized protein n=1 Tax=Cylindrobasidium torrendii FP15055 ss-10 TaxID=1314674 RepID=A0A0D7B741_9AGAR|nr:hypothetical protein CYLTODRAFT_45308 [Cylindrobasidium torrendii FP15055 ss-10]